MKIKKVFVEKSNFRNTIFNDSIITNSIFKDSGFIMSEFENVNITNSVFENCNMMFSNFENSIIVDTCFKANNMKNVNFKDTVLFNTIFENIENSQSINFENAYYNLKTQLPEGIEDKEKKMLFIDNEIDEKYIILKKEFEGNKNYDEKHPLREFDIFVKNNLYNLNKEDDNSFILHLILSDIILRYKVIFKDFADRTDKFIKNKDMYLKNFSNKERGKIKLLIESYNENIHLSQKY
ncbi:MAG: pentapeptide repeat-containing protein [Fusobacteriales bacterium]|nr:pentapeptide repeat-containing protein [Fusobacteriales bacterium]